jgi:uroporphyrinogen-III synthase
VYGQTDFTPQIIRGESSGTGEKLAHYIRNQPEADKPMKLLYLTGDKNRDTVPTILKAANIELFSLSVYETRGSHTFERDLETALKISSKGILPCFPSLSRRLISRIAASRRWWIIHFAPSAADFVVPILDKHLRPDELTIKIAAIGPVTASFLRDELKINVDVVSAKPVPQDLVAAIIAHDGN